MMDSQHVLYRNINHISIILKSLQVLAVAGVPIALFLGFTDPERLMHMVFLPFAEPEFMLIGILYRVASALGGTPLLQMTGCGLFLAVGFALWNYCSLSHTWLQGVKSNTKTASQIIHSAQGLDTWLSFCIWGSLAYLCWALFATWYNLGWRDTVLLREDIIAIMLLVKGIAYLGMIYFPANALRTFLKKATARLNGENLKLQIAANKLSNWALVVVAFLLLNILGVTLNISLIPLPAEDLLTVEEERIKDGLYYGLYIFLAALCLLTRNIALGTAKVLDKEP